MLNIQCDWALTGTVTWEQYEALGQAILVEAGITWKDFIAELDRQGSF